MNVKESHIHVERGLQRYNANVYDYFQPDDLDLILTKMQNRFIDLKFRQDREGEGFSYDQGDLDDIEALIVEGYEIPVFQDVTRFKGKAVFPSNYRYLLDSESLVYKTCLEPNSINYDLLDTEESIEYLYSYSFSSTTLADSELSNPYDNLRITFNGSVIFDIANYPKFDSFIYSEDDLFMILNFLLGELNRDLPVGIKGIYWERYRDVSVPNSLIVVSDLDVLPQLSIISNGNDIQLQAGITPIVNNVSTNTGNTKVSNRLVRGDKRSKNLYNNAFTKTIARNPLCTESETSLTVNYNKRFIITQVSIDYIRIPRYISLSLDRGFETREHTHERICDLAIEYIKNIIEQPSYQTILKDNLLRNE